MTFGVFLYLGPETLLITLILINCLTHSLDFRQQKIQQIKTLFTGEHKKSHNHDT